MNTDEIYESWANGKLTRSDLGEAIVKKAKGEKIDSNAVELLRDCTVCPVGDPACNSLITITVPAFHPQKPLQKETVKICPFGCKAETCLFLEAGRC